MEILDNNCFIYIFVLSKRVEQYNAYSSTEFCNAGFDILDYYPITDAYPEGTGTKKTPHDPVHYEYHVMQPMERLLERVFQVTDWDHFVEFRWNVLITSNVMPGEPMEGLLEYVLKDCNRHFNRNCGKDNIMCFARKEIWKFVRFESDLKDLYKYSYYWLRQKYFENVWLLLKVLKAYMQKKMSVSSNETISF